MGAENTKEKSRQCFTSLNNPQNSEIKICGKCEVY
jgi:hypothetical protein